MRGMRLDSGVGLLLVLFLAGCAQPDPAGPPAAQCTTGCDLHLYVSNQSFDDPTADLLVRVDGAVLFDGEARVEGQHTWVLREMDLAPGTHRIDALERDTGAEATRSFVLPPGEERWAVVDYWGAKGDGSAFTLSVHEEPVAFA
jgi:hypothetical protein